MKNLYESLLLESISDDSIWYRTGINKLNWLFKDWTGIGNSLENIIKKYNISKSDPRPGIIKYMKDTNAPLPKNSEEFIARDSWDLNSLIGETESQLLHKDYYDFANHILKDKKKKSNVLAIFQCSSSKPYSANRIYKTNYFNPYSDYCDFACISNPGIIPIDYSQYYPYRYDEWNIPNEEKLHELIDMTKKYRIVNMCRFIRFVKEMGYSHVLVAIGNEMKQWIFEEMLKHNVAGCSKWLHIITDSTLRNSLSKEYPQIGNLLGSRIMNLPATKDRFARQLKKYASSKLKDGIQQAYQERKEHVKESAENPSYQIKDHIDYNEFIKKFKEEIQYNMENDKIDKGDNNLYYKSYYWTALDLLLMAMDGDLLEDIDDEYAKFNQQLTDDKDFVKVGEFVFCYKPLMDKDKVSEHTVRREALDLQIIQKKHRPKLNMKMFN